MRNKSIEQISNNFTVITITDEHGDKTYATKIKEEKFKGYGKFKTLREAQLEKMLIVLQEFESQFGSSNAYSKNKHYIDYLARYEAKKNEYNPKFSI